MPYQNSNIGTESFDADKFVNSCESPNGVQPTSFEELYIRDQAMLSARTQDQILGNNNMSQRNLERKSPFTRSKKTKVKKEKRSTSREVSPIDNLGMKAS